MANKHGDRNEDEDESDEETTVSSHMKIIHLSAYIYYN